MKNENGFTLIELVIVLLIFLMVIFISTSAFDTIFSKGGVISRSTESDISGVVGLELLRSDIQQAGFGLPWSFPATPDPYTEVDVVSDFLADGIDTNSFNDAPTEVPRAIQSGTSTSTGIDYLVIKSTSIAENNTAKKWSFISYSGNDSGNKSYIRKWNTSDDISYTNNERVITIKARFLSGGATDRQLVMNGSAYFYEVTSQDPPNDAYKPGDSTESFMIYGITNSSDLVMPFNRADYYVNKPTSGMSQACAPNTGNLYKATAVHSSGGFISMPLLDCVADFQVAFDLDSGSGPATTTSLVGMTAQDIREQVKAVKVYILTHEGGKDKSYHYPNSTIAVGPVGSGRVFDLATKIGADYVNYRWKVYSLTVRPKNLN